MAIAFTKYVDITSVIGAGASVGTRDLIGRLFTNNNLLPPESFVEFSTLEEVGDYFNTTSEEYLRAEFYFSFISKGTPRRPQKISFARWVSAAVAPRVYGVPANYVLANFTSVSAGSLTITMGAVTAHQLTAIDLSAATSLADVASAVQAAIRAYTSGSTEFTAAGVAYDASNKRFTLVGGVTGTSPMAITAGTTGVDIAGLLGWLNGSIQADGAGVETITDTLQNSSDASNNFGSFLFMPALSQDEVTEAATWNKTQNITFIYNIPVLAANAAAMNAAVLPIGGCEVTLSPLAEEYPEMCPMVILAATDYTAQNSVQNYMFYQFPTLTPSVTTTSDSDLYDGLRINYIGATQTAGQQLAFYQRGLMMGGDLDPSDLNVYANEEWLKDYIGAQIMTLFLSLPKISANKGGVNILQNLLNQSINLALTNGVISVGKPLTAVDQLYITELTNDPLAWHQVQDIGYWLDVALSSYVTGGRTEWKATYTLIYSKDDDVRKVEGSHILI